MKTVCLISGGLDSAVMMYDYIAQQHDVRAIAIDYGQRHSKELAYAQRLCDGVKVPLKLVGLPGLRDVLGGSSQTDDIDVPHGHYTGENMKVTVVPNRNMIFLSIAAAYAISIEADIIAYGCHGGDHAIYPDCRPPFTLACGKAILEGNWHKVKLETPFICITKTDIVRRGHKLKVPFVDTWTCYEGLEDHCGECGACVERKEAFMNAWVKDTTEYAI